MLLLGVADASMPAYYVNFVPASPQDGLFMHESCSAMMLEAATFQLSAPK